MGAWSRLANPEAAPTAYQATRHNLVGEAIAGFQALAWIYQSSAWLNLVAAAAVSLSSASHFVPTHLYHEGKV